MNYTLRPINNHHKSPTKQLGTPTFPSNIFTPKYLRRHSSSPNLLKQIESLFMAYDLLFLSQAQLYNFKNCTNIPAENTHDKSHNWCHCSNC